MTREHTPDDIETLFITHDDIDGGSPKFMRSIYPNRGLSAAAYEDLCDDITDNGAICLIEIKMNDKEWLRLSSNPTTFIGYKADNKQPLYATDWADKQYLYYPFTFGLQSIRSTGEITASTLTAVNYNYEIAQILENPVGAVPMKLYVLGKKFMDTMISAERMYLTTYKNTVSEISGELAYYNVMAEQCPSSRFYPGNYKF